MNAKKQERHEQRGQVHLFMGNVLKYLADYPSPIDAFAQGVENAADAHKRVGHSKTKGRIWVTVGQGKISVTDDAHGMISEMPAKDKQRLLEFYNPSPEGKKVVRQRQVTLQDIIPPDSPSLQCLETMILAIALSGKNPGQEGIQGMRGIGALAPYAYARHYTVTSKPSLKLASKYMGAPVAPEDNFAATLYPPTLEQLGEGDLSYNIIWPSGELLDPFDQPLAHGTRVDIVDVQEHGRELFDLPRLKLFLRSKFGSDIKAGHYELYLVDATAKGADTDKSKRKSIYIDPPVYRGSLLFDGDLFMPGGHKFRAQLWCDISTTSKERDLDIGYKGSPRIPMTNKSVFQVAPWNTGVIWGRIDFPTYPNENELWNARKDDLRDTAQFQEWARVVNKFAQDKLLPAISLLEENSQEKTRKLLGQQLEQAMLAAIGKIESLSSLLIEAPVKPKADATKTKPKTRTTKGTLTDVRASVRNNIGKGLEGLQIELWRDRSVLDVRKTGLSGSVTFGEQIAGNYAVVLVIPKDDERFPKLVPLTAVEDHFTLQNIGEYHPTNFRVDDGSEPEKVEKGRGLNIELTPLDDPERPFEFRELDKSIHINTNFEPLAEAMNTPGTRFQTLLASYAATAFALYILKGDPDYVWMQREFLFTELQAEFIQRWEKSKRQAK